jgi:hypothetical protein
MDSLKRFAPILAAAAVLAPAFAAAEDSQAVPTSCLTALMASLPREYAVAPVVRETRTNGFSPLEFLDLSSPTTTWALKVTNAHSSQTVAHLSCTVNTRTGEIVNLQQ